MRTHTLILLVAALLFCSLMQNVQAKPVLLKQRFSSPSASIDTFERDIFGARSTVYVQGGNFIMGTTSDIGYSEPDEFPTNTVYVSSFVMYKSEVTQALYANVMNYNPSRFNTDSQNPVERVSWYNAIEFCNRLSMIRGLSPCYTYTGFGTNPDNWPHNWNTYFHNNITCDWNAGGYRLPTEAEWEYAAKGGATGSNYTYSGSNTLDDVAWYNGNSSQTNPVKTKQPNQLGIYDMTGNVHEWCWDWYGNYLSASQENPHGPDTGLYKVRRGGAWDGDYTFQRTSNRTYTYIMYDYEGMGFRIVRNTN